MSNTTNTTCEYTQEAYTEFLRERAAEGGFIRECDMAAIVACDPYRQLLIRCGMGRYKAEARNVAAKIEQIEAEGDYVRDVCYPAIDPIFVNDFCWRQPQPTTMRTPSGFPSWCYVGNSFDDYGPSDADPGL